MHQAMLNRHIEQGPIGNQSRQFLARRAQCRIDFLADSRVVLADFLRFRPRRRGLIRQLPVHRVDSEREQHVEFRMKTRQLESAAPEKIPVEGLHVAEIKNQPVAFGNRALVQRAFAQQGKHAVRFAPRFREPRLQQRKRLRQHLRRGHGNSSRGQVLPFYSSQAPFTTLDSPSGWMDSRDIYARYVRLWAMFQSVGVKRFSLRYSINFRKALPRWLTSFFSASLNSANVRCRSAK